MVYCDPSIDSDTGTGTSGDPYGRYAYALSSLTFDTTNGTQLNIKAGTAITLSAAPSISFSPGLSNPFIQRGYTSVANDGGRAEIDGDGLYQVAPFTSKNGLSYIDMILGNSGNNDIVGLNAYSYVQNCKIYGSTKTGGYGLRMQIYSQVLNCEFTDIAGDGFLIKYAGARICGCHFYNSGSSDFRRCVSIGSNEALVSRNTFSIDGASDAIYTSSGHNLKIQHNSILSSSGTGTGIDLTGSSINTVIHSNLIEGFSGSGGIGINISSSTTQKATIRNNAAYNNTTNYSGLTSGDYQDQQVGTSDADNETLSASPFAKSGADTFANRATYFAPIDTGNVRGGAYVGA